ncbi:uncharacterized protein LOC131284698 [Anopheles ziemanni]|uniref:uncharacterized protein LOC131284698 n=1 Tax=Anopheles ziemanni TaxID=345580 RepID=UPI0026602659|nr:uncharacterized protein LOC131284698 [Anopheles ziemanni]
MSDRPDNSREFITEFIELYKSMPCLWYNKSTKYRDKALKNKAYGILLEKYLEIDETATRTTVKAKINTLRTTYRKVLGKLCWKWVNTSAYKPWAEKN